MSGKKVSIHVLSDFNRLREIEDAWNALISNCSKNPIFSSGFVKQFMEFYRSRGWTPLVLAISVDNRITGIAPLMTKKKFGVRFIKFLFKSWFSPRFIFDNQFQEEYMVHILDFLFKTLRCQFVDLTLPADSPNLPILMQKCKADKIYFSTRPEMGHRVIPIECTWNEFKKLRGKNFRRKFKKIERSLDRAGSWSVTCVESENKESDVLKRILDVERRSWKKAWRNQIGLKTDQDLLMIWNGLQYTARIEPNFKWSVWFLKLNDRALAYALALQYKEVAFIMKSSYDERYKRFYPGIFVINAAVRELFDKRQVRKIDFLVDLPFHRTWTSTCLPRVRVMMSRKGVATIMMRASPKLVEFLSVASPRQLKQMAKLLRTQLSNKLSLETKRLQGIS